MLWPLSNNCFFVHCQGCTVSESCNNFFGTSSACSSAPQGWEAPLSQIGKMLWRSSWPVQWLRLGDRILHNVYVAIIYHTHVVKTSAWSSYGNSCSHHNLSFSMFPQREKVSLWKAVHFKHIWFNLNIIQLKLLFPSQCVMFNVGTWTCEWTMEAYHILPSWTHYRTFFF